MRWRRLNRCGRASRGLVSLISAVWDGGPGVDLGLAGEAEKQHAAERMLRRKSLTFIILSEEENMDVEKVELPAGTPRRRALKFAVGAGEVDVGLALR